MPRGQTSKDNIPKTERWAEEEKNNMDILSFLI